LHDNVLCTHGPQLEIAKTPLNGSIDRLHTLSLDNEAFAKLSLDEYFDRLEAHPHTVYGSVHGFGPEVYLDAPKQRRDYLICHVTRHPMTRLASFVRRWRREAERNAQRLAYHLGQFVAHANIREWISRDYAVDFAELDNVLFVNAAMQMLALERRFFSIRMPVFKMEGIVNDPEYLTYFLMSITGGRLALSADYFERLRALPPVDCSGPEARTAYETQLAWADWQRALFKGVVDRLELRPTYRSLGYQIDF
jgi:hypothetical protein